MKKIFISQPMRGRSDEEIQTERQRLFNNAAASICLNNDDIEVLDTFFDDFEEGTHPLVYLAKSIEFLSKADLVVFAPDWNQNRGCRIEYECCREYNIPILIST